MAGIENFLGNANSAVSFASGSAGLLDSIFGWSAKRQERAQKRMMDKQQDQWKEQQQILADQQLEQWTRENEYNDPTNYYKRLLEGADRNGISKSAIIGNQPGGSVGQSATGVKTPGSTGAGLGSVAPLGVGSASSLGNLKQRAEINYMDALAEQARAGADKAKSDISLNEFKMATEQATSNLLAEQALSEKSKRSLQDAQSLLTNLEVDNYQKITDADIARTWSQVCNYNIDTKNKEKEGRYIEKRAEAQLDQIRSQIAVDLSVIIANKANALLHGAMADQYSITNATLSATQQYEIEKIMKEVNWYNYNQLKHLFNDVPSAINKIVTSFKKEKNNNGGIPLSLVWKILSKM